MVSLAGLWSGSSLSCKACGPGDGRGWIGTDPFQPLSNPFSGTSQSVFSREHYSIQVRLETDFKEFYLDGVFFGFAQLYSRPFPR